MKDTKEQVITVKIDKITREEIRKMIREELEKALSVLHRTSSAFQKAIKAL